MKRASALTLLFGLPLLAQVSSSVSLSNGIQLRISTTLGQPVGSHSLTAALTAATGNSFYRVYRDETGLAVFAYEIAVDRSTDGTQIIVSTKPAGTEFSQTNPNADGGKPTPTIPAGRTFPRLRSGDHVDVNTFSIPGTGANATDTLWVTLSQRGANPAMARSSPPLNGIRFASLDVYIGHDLISQGGSRGTVVGRYAMFFVPSRGAYFFAVDKPTQPGFLQAGVVDGNTLRFTIDNISYECKSSEPILVSSDGGELWILHDPAYQPTSNWTQPEASGANGKPPSIQFFTAAADSLSWWLAR